MENKNNDQPEIHSNNKNDIGSQVNSGAKHGAGNQLKGNEDKPESANKETTDDLKGESPAAPVTPVYNGNNDPDANKTPNE